MPFAVPEHTLCHCVLHYLCPLFSILFSQHLTVGAGDGNPYDGALAVLGLDAYSASHQLEHFLAYRQAKSAASACGDKAFEDVVELVFRNAITRVLNRHR